MGGVDKHPARCYPSDMNWKRLEDIGFALFALLAICLTVHQVRYNWRDWRWGENA